MTRPAIVRENMAPWRRDIPLEFIARVAAQERFERAPLIEYLQAANACVQREVITMLGRERNIQDRSSSAPPGKDAKLQDDISNGIKPGYDAAIVQCPDARHAYFLLSLLLSHRIIHQRTAGSTVIRGAMFQTLKEGGLASVESHKKCGACKAAHDLEKSTDAEVHYTIARIVDAIEYYVRILEDAEIRDRANAKKQAFVAEQCLELAGRGELVHPAFFSWDEGRPNLQWLDSWLPDGIPSKVREKILNDPARRARMDALLANPLMLELEEAARISMAYAQAEGRDFTTQYATMALLYDPYRLDRIRSIRPGCINDPRIILGELGNGFFATTMDLRPFDPAFERHREKVSRTAMGSVVYAALDKHNGHYGHVGGVGGKDGTHLLGIMDISEVVLERLTKHLVDTHPIVAELTRGGKDIIKMLYHPDKVKVEFLEG